MKTAILNRQLLSYRRKSQISHLQQVAILN